MKKSLKIVNDNGKIRVGRAYVHWGMRYEYEPIYKVYGPSRHMTLVFNLFVFL